MQAGGVKMQNPYTSRNMIRDGAAFFGRQSEIEEIFRNLTVNFQNTSIVGERRSGKSSLLWHISRPEVCGQFSEGKPFLFIFFDLQRVANLNQRTFFKLLSENLAEQLPPEYALNAKDFDTCQEYFDGLVEEAYDHFRIVICLDEFETVATNDQFDNAFLLYLRHFANLGKIAYVTSSREPLEVICKSTDHLQGSDFWNIFIIPPLYLGVLKKDEAVQLVRVPSENAGMVFDQSEIDYVFELAGHHALFLQIACFYLFETKNGRFEASEPGDLSQLDRSHIADNFLMGATPHFENIWNRLTPSERKVLVSLETIKPDGDFKEAMRALIRRGLLIPGDPPTLFCRTFALFAKENYSPDRSAATGDLPSISMAVPGNLAERAGQGTAKPATERGAKGISRQAKMDIWIGRNSEVLLHFTGPYTISQFCPNRARMDSTTIKRFDSRVRSLPRVDNWRLAKQDIGQEVFDLFEQVPEVSQVYTGGRAAVDDDESFLLTFKCPQEMLAFPFEFINSLSAVDEGQKHLVLSHPLRKSIVGIRSKKTPLDLQFYSNNEVKILLVSSNVSGTVALNSKNYALPEIPGACDEIEAIGKLINRGKELGNVQCSVEVKHDLTCEEMADLLQCGEYDIVHYSGHALYSESPESSCLFFWSEPGGKKAGNTIEALSANQLNVLVERSKIRFIYLSCCQGAMVGSPDQLMNNDFLGIAHSLLVGGIPSVLSMRWPLNDEMAILLASSFYKELFNGQGVEIALFRARKQVQGRLPNDFNWLSPVLVVQAN
jgi:hypothetical protein